jgi:excisionase family DNA binding protein
MRDVLTPEQVADYLQVNTETVYRLIRGRQLAAAKIGRVYRIPKADVEAFLHAQSTRPDVRHMLVERVAKIATRNAARSPSLTSDDVLDELEAMDDEQRRIPPLRA